MSIMSYLPSRRRQLPLWRSLAVARSIGDLAATWTDWHSTTASSGLMTLGDDRHGSHTGGSRINRHIYQVRDSPVMPRLAPWSARDWTELTAKHIVVLSRG